MHSNKDFRKPHLIIPPMNQGITLLSVPGKLFAMLLLKRSISSLHALRCPQQAGFMPGRSTTEQIHTVRQIVEKTLEFNKKAYIFSFTFILPLTLLTGSPFG